MQSIAPETTLDRGEPNAWAEIWASYANKQRQDSNRLPLMDRPSRVCLPTKAKYDLSK